MYGTAWGAYWKRPLDGGLFTLYTKTMKYVFNLPREYSFEKFGIKGKIFQTSTLTNKAQFFLVDTEKGHETTIIEHESDFIYYILHGDGCFIINDRKEECAAGNLVVIPSGTKFTYEGKLKMLVASIPPWQEEQEETVS